MAGRSDRSVRLVVCAWVGMLLLGCTRPLLQASLDEGAVAPAARTRPVRLEERTWHAVSLEAAARQATTGQATAGKGSAGEKRLFLLPIEFEADNGATNGNANLLRLLPAYEWPHRSSWRIQHLDLITFANAPGGVPGSPGNPSPIPGERATGLGDLVHASFFSPEPTGDVIWGVGAALGIPTATEDVLGSGKWSAGPALRATYRKGPWNLGAIGTQRWSFAGASSRADISQLMVRGTLRHQLENDWFLVSAPIITANWLAANSERWLVPLGGGIGRKFEFGGLTWAASVQGYANVIKPTGAPDWAVRLGLTAIIPLGK